MSIYIVIAKEDNERLEYEYGCLDHAVEHYNLEQSAELVEYKKGEYHLMQAK